jgi:hypothetical protein
VEVGCVHGRRDVFCADQEITEAPAFAALFRIGRKQRIECRQNAVVVEVFRVEFRQARAVEGAAEIKIISPAFADKADFGDVGTAQPFGQPVQMVILVLNGDHAVRAVPGATAGSARSPQALDANTSRADRPAMSLRLSAVRERLLWPLRTAHEASEIASPGDQSTQT